MSIARKPSKDNARWRLSNSRSLLTSAKTLIWLWQ